MAHRLGAAGFVVALFFGSHAQAEPVCMQAVLQGGAGTMPLVVEVVATEESRAKGLMFVESMPINRGMLFVFDTPGRHGFWMQNTPIPLDIVPLAEDGTILETLQGVPYNTDVLLPATPVLRILEVNAGLVATMDAGNGKGRFVLTGGTDCGTTVSASEKPRTQTDQPLDQAIDPVNPNGKGTNAP